VRKMIAAGVVALGGLMTTGVGVSNADVIQVEGSYATQAACMADGPHVEVDHSGCVDPFLV